MKVFGPGIAQQFVPNHDGLKKCVDLGREVGAAINDSVPA